MRDNNYYLMRKDVPVCEFNINRPKSKGNVRSVEMISVLEKRLPIEMQKGMDLGHFLRERLKPIFRRHIGKKIITNGGYLTDNLENIIEYTGAFSLIDDFWLKQTDDDGKSWAAYNLFDNEFDEQVSLLAFTKKGTYEADGFIRSPEFTTDGMVGKAWRKINGVIYLYKAELGWMRHHGG